MKNIISYKKITPDIHNSSFIAHNAIIAGDVKIDKEASIWFGCSIRGDVAKIIIGSRTNIQDNCVLHGTRPNHIQNKTGADGAPVIIGSGTTIGHSSIIHACIIEDNCFIGMGTILMDLSRVEEFGMLAAGAVLTPKKVVRSGEIWAGNPAKFFRNMTDEERNYIKVSANNYFELAQEYTQSNSTIS